MQVYRGVLPTGELITIKRALREWMQPGLEFKTEIELLSRVHHRNVVSLVGFCLERGEQMLIYKFVSNGSLMESLSGTFISSYDLSILQFDSSGPVTWSLLSYTFFIMRNFRACHITLKWYTSYRKIQI